MPQHPQLFEIAKAVGAQGFVTKRPNGRKADRSSRWHAQQENVFTLVIVLPCVGALLPTLDELIPVRLLDPLPVVNAQNSGYHV